MPDYGPLYAAAGNQFNIDPLLLQSMAAQESGQGANLGPSTAGAKGFMQFLPSTAAKYGVDTQDATSSVFGASNYMNDLLNQHGESLAHALADYGGTTPDSKYVSDVMGRYNTLKAAWAKTGPGTAGVGPATDTDPASPTFGQSTGKNFTPPPSTPGADTTAKGNAGQPAPSVPTTDTPGISMATAPGTTFAPPQAGGPKGQRQAAPSPAQSEKNDPLSQAKPHVNDDGTPIAPAQAAPAEANDPLSQAQPHVNEDGTPITAQPTMDTGQYLTAPTSPGAKAVGAQPSGTPIAEGRVPGPDFQAAINLATDQAQKARIAGHWLFPNDAPDQAADRIIIGPGGRMAAVPDSGQPYFIEPAPVFNPQTGYTKVPGAFADVTAAPDWHQIGAAQVTPYSRAAPLGPGATAANIPLAMGGAIPGTVQNYLTAAPAAIGGPLAGGVLTAAASQAAQSGRQYLANRFDPDYAAAPSALPTPGSVRNALMAGAGAYGLRFLGGQFEQALNRPLESPGIFGGEYGPNLGTSTQFPASAAPGYGAWPVAPAQGRQPMPVGPNVPLEAKPLEPGLVVNDAQRSRRLLEAPGAEGQVVDPFEGAGERTGPYSPTSAQETAAQPTHLPPPRFPILTQNQVEQRADDIIRHFAQGGNTTPDERQLISQAGLPQTTGNGGLAALWRYMGTSTPEGINAMQAFKDRALLARRTFTRNLVGTPDDLNALEAARSANTQQTYNAAFGPGQTASVNAQPVLDKIDEILRSPEGLRSDIADPLRRLRDMFYERDPLTGQLPADANGNPIRTLITDPERLYQVRRDINDSMRGPMANSNLPNARAASHLLGDVQNTLDDTIAGGAPNYPAYMQQYQAQSKEINAMKFLQGRNLTDANGDTTLVKVDGAIKAAERDRNLDPRMRPADALTDDQMSQLFTLRDDLRRQANETKGKALGSDTQQNFSTSAFVNNLVSPAARLGARAAALKFGAATGLPGAEYGAMAAEQFIENKLTGGETRAAALRQAVIRRLLNEDGSGARALAGAQAPGLGP